MAVRLGFLTRTEPSYSLLPTPHQDFNSFHFSLLIVIGSLPGVLPQDDLPHEQRSMPLYIYVKCAAESNSCKTVCPAREVMSWSLLHAPVESSVELMLLNIEGGRAHCIANSGRQPSMITSDGDWVHM